MKRLIGILILFSLFTTLHAQYQVRFIVKENTYIHHNDIYITGSFNKWDSLPDKRYLMQPYGKKQKSIVLNLPAGEIRYKFTRGSWLTVEKQFSGGEVDNRVIKITKNTTLTDSVKAWRDVIISDKWLALEQQKSDTTRVKILTAIANIYAFYPEWYNADSALSYAQNGLQLQQKILASKDYKTLNKQESISQLIGLQEVMASLLHALGNYPKSLEIRMENLRLAEKGKDKYTLLWVINSIISDYNSMKDYPSVLSYGRKLDSIINISGSKTGESLYYQFHAMSNIANAFFKMHMPDSALLYAKKMASVYETDQPLYLTFGNLLLADIYAAKGASKSAFYYYRQVIPNAMKIYNGQSIARAHEGMARLYQKEGKLDSALFFARQSLSYFQNNKIDVQAWGENSNVYIAEIAPLLADLYRKNNQLDSAYKYLYLSVSLKDSLYNLDKVRQFQTLAFNESTRRQQLDQQTREAKQQYDAKVKMYGLLTGLIGFLIIALILYRNNKHKQKANTLLQSQKQEIEKTLGELKTTQSQLIQSEKMASLGELTAGIAHEIQNPLNFINNFSDVNTELIDEMKAELKAGNYDDALSIANDIVENEKKINHHGKRADAIVKGMLQHSRSNGGVIEPTNINALADEYFRLAYHGLRAKDKSFNAVMKTDFDQSIGNIDVIPQDMGRVILNLITNAFYAVAEKVKIQQAASHSTVKEYEPTVSVSTKIMDQKVMISVKDNGNGISQKILDKIFHPFFTTKPAGQGTGLGLSMSYDIIKVHGGELKVSSVEGEGAEFRIFIPLNQG